MKPTLILASGRCRLGGGLVIALATLSTALVAGRLVWPAVLTIAAMAAIGAVGWWTAEQPPPTDETHELVARMSHELRTPLTSVLGLLDVLNGDGASIDDEERCELLSVARAEAEHMEHLVANLHTASRLARNALEPRPEPTDVAHVVMHVVDRFPAVARRTYVPSSDLRAFADPRLTAQIVTNLIQNVERYAPDGELSIAVERRGSTVAIVFSDDGPGIPAQRAGRVFERGLSDHGLGIGLALSKELAEAMRGRLVLEPPRRAGATFTLTLPRTDLEARSRSSTDRDPAVPVVAHSPRARLLVDLAAAFAERSLDRTMAGVHRLYVELLNATSTVLMIPEGDMFRAISGSASRGSPWIFDATLSHVLRTATTVELTGLTAAGVPEWQGSLDGNAALLVPVIDDDVVVGVLVVAFDHPNDIPGGRAVALAEALAQLTAFAIHRASLARDVAFERTLRSTVMESLPIAISVFAGDPPTLVDWNQRERDMLGLTSDVERPSDLDGSQTMFNVRFADGTPLTVDNAPVTAAIRTGGTAGPFLLLVTRADGSEITTRTYCAPFFHDNGSVAGAVVTSETVDVNSSHRSVAADTTAPLRGASTATAGGGVGNPGS